MSTDYITTGTATVTWNNYDITDLTVTITSADGTEIDWYSLKTSAYADPYGEFDADCFDANTLAEDVAGELASGGWRPAESISVDSGDDSSVVFEVEKF